MSEQTTRAGSKCHKHGYDRHHPKVLKEIKYSLWGWFLLSFGVTAIPLQIDYRCSECRELFATSKDREDLVKEAP